MQKNIIRVIEFVFSNPLKEEVAPQPLLALFKIEDIVSITQIDQHFSLLTLNTGQTYKLFGTSRSLHNRYLYALEKEGNLYYDPIIRPSSAIYHNPHKLEGDEIFIDSFQLTAFFQATKPELLNNKIIQNNINIMQDSL